MEQLARINMSQYVLFDPRLGSTYWFLIISCSGLRFDELLLLDAEI